VIKLTVSRVDAALADFKLRSMHVIVHGRLSNTGLLVNRIAADVLRLKDGTLVEHWDVIQNEATKQQSRSVNLVEDLNAQTNCPLFGVAQIGRDWIALFDPCL
jgi:hypothetical protein